MITTFYAPPEAFRDEWVRLPEDEAHHAVRVLRHRPGDEVIVVDGAGGWYRLCLEQVDRHGVWGRVLETRRDVGEPPYHLTVGLALLKQTARFETFLEKAVELGVSAIVPLLTARTERTHFRLERARRLLGRVAAWLTDVQAGVVSYGPATAPLERRAGRFRLQLLLSSPRRDRLHEVLSRLLPELRGWPEGRGVRWSLDVDPQDLS